MSALLPILILVPFIGSFLNGIIIRPKDTTVSGILASSCAGISFICSLLLFLNFQGTPLHHSFDWFQVGTWQARWGFTFDALTAVMCLVVTGIGTLIHIYSIGYMSHDKSPHRYFAYLNLFLANMLILVTADSLLGMFVGWEGVGLCSYLLIGFWFEDSEKAKAGMKAFIVNRIGDAGFLMGMFLCFQLFHSLVFSEMSAALLNLTVSDTRLFNLAALYLFVGATGKSAQIPLYIWLPEAMAGPTPVSALIHAATMVTAGIYMICRMSFLFQICETTNQCIAIIGLSTALLAALIATSQKDIKKVLAYSTVSQLGLMFLALGVKSYFGAIFHVMTHAFFKALMFLGAGSVIHALDGEQNIYEMGGLRKKLPITFATFAIGTFAICGVPPLSGFFSKDTILFDAFMGGGTVLWLGGVLVSALTAFYMTRLFVLVFAGTYRGKAQHPHESPPVMLIPLILLAIGSVTAGWLGMPHGLHLAPNFLAHFLSKNFSLIPETPTPVSEQAAMALTTGLALVMMAISYWLYILPSRSEVLSKGLAPLKLLCENKFWVDELYGMVLVGPFQRISHFLSHFFDKQIVDGGLLLPARISKFASLALSIVQLGSVQFYLLILLVGSLGIFWFGVWRG